MSAVRPRVEVFACSTGDFYTPSQVRRRCRTGAWRFCLLERTSGRVVVEASDRSLVVLSPVKPADLPPWVELRREASDARAVDTRRGRPAKDGDREPRRRGR